LDLIKIYFGIEKYEIIRNKIAEELEPLHTKLNNQMILEDDTRERIAEEEPIANTFGLHSFSNLQPMSSPFNINETINYGLNNGIQNNSSPFKH